MGKQRSLAEFPIAELDKYHVSTTGNMADRNEEQERGEMDQIVESFVIPFWEALFIFKWSCYHKTPFEFYKYSSMVKIVTDKITMILSLLNPTNFSSFNDRRGEGGGNDDVLVESTTTDSDNNDTNNPFDRNEYEDYDLDDIERNRNKRNENNNSISSKEKRKMTADLDEWF